MIRPYIAVVKDSFRAAAASKVLYVLLLLVTLLLLALFPLGVQEQLASTIYEQDLVDGISLCERITKGGEQETKTPMLRVWERLPTRTQRLLREIYGERTEAEAAAEGQQSPQSLEPFSKIRALGEVMNELNEILNDREFYDEESWDGYVLNEEAQDLLDEGPDQISQERVRRLNRLLINTAFARELSPGLPTSLRLKYLHWTMFEALPIRKKELPQYLNFAYILDKFVLSIGVFIAILVTASVVPQTLEPGSLNLLLSKPIYRWALFLSKYLGACVFTLFFAAYLFVGLWLFFGTRIGLWDPAFLYCIPIYILVFGVYYSVSALAGAWFRSTIIAVVISILFWFICFIVGLVYSVAFSMASSYEINQIIVAGDDIIQLDVKNVPAVWDRDEGKWTQTFIADESLGFVGMVHSVGANSSEFTLPEMIGLIYDEEDDRLITAQSSAMFGPGMMVNDSSLGVGRAADEWKYEESFRTPPLTISLFQEADGSLITVSRLGTIHRLKGDLDELMDEYRKLIKEASATPVPSDEDIANDPTLTESSIVNQDGEIDFEVFEEVGPVPPLDFSLPSLAVMNQQTKEILSYSRGTIEIVTRQDDGRYARADNNSLTLPGPTNLSAQVHFGGSQIIVARGNGQIFRIDRETMQVIESFEPEPNSAIRSISGSDDGRWFSAVFSNGRLWLMDTEAAKVEMVRAKTGGQGDISAAAFDNRGSVWVADRGNRLRRYRLDGMSGKNRQKAEETLKPNEGVVGKLYRSVLSPIYVVCPKPGEFYRLVDHLTSAEVDSEELERKDSELRDPWEPLWNGAIFIAAMLLLGCLYIERRDF